MLVELRRVEIPMNCCKIFEAKLIGAMGAVPYTRLFHAKPPLKRPAAAGIRPSSAASQARLTLNYSATQGWARAIVGNRGAAKALHCILVYTAARDVISRHCASFCCSAMQINQRVLCLLTICEQPRPLRRYSSPSSESASYP